jgi:hypothetical protein
VSEPKQSDVKRKVALMRRDFDKKMEELRLAHEARVAEAVFEEIAGKDIISDDELLEVLRHTLRTSGGPSKWAVQFDLWETDVMTTNNGHRKFVPKKIAAALGYEQIMFWRKIKEEQ